MSPGTKGAELPPYLETRRTVSPERKLWSYTNKSQEYEASSDEEIDEEAKYI
jgi:hypothetical protein